MADFAVAGEGPHAARVTRGHVRQRAARGAQRRGGGEQEGERAHMVARALVDQFGQFHRSQGPFPGWA